MTYLNGITPPLKQDLEFLEHYGVMGMKWGVRNAPKVSRPTSSEVYKARNRVAAEKRGLKSKRQSIRAAKRPETKAKRKAEYAEMKLKFLNNPDRVTQQRITKGDVALIATLNLITAGVATGPTVALVGGRLGVPKIIEKRQKSGDYNRVARNRAFNARNAAR